MRTTGLFVMALGVCLVAVSVWEAWRTAWFLSQAHHAQGVISRAAAHPQIRFVDLDGREIEFRQNGFVFGAVNTPVEVAYLPSDPEASAVVVSFLALWGSTLWLSLPGVGCIVLSLTGVAFGGAGRYGRW